MSIDIVRWTASRLPGVDDTIRRELAESAGANADRGGRVDRALEAGSLLGFALRSMSRRGALDDRREMVRQGVRVGALVLALASALHAMAAPSVALALGASVTAVAIAAGLRVGAVVAAAMTVVAVVAATGSPEAWSLAVLAAVALGHRFDARTCPIGGAICATALTAGGAMSAIAPATTSTAIVTVAVIVAASGLLAVGWFDPRFAVAATIVWCCRFVDTDMTRWIPLLAGLAVGTMFTDVALRRTLTA